MELQLDIEKQKSQEPASTVMNGKLGGSEFKFACNPVLVPLLQEQRSISIKTYMSLF